MKEVIPASGTVLAIMINISNFIDWSTLSLIFGIILSLFMIVYYIMKMYDQYLVTKRRKELKKHLNLDEDYEKQIN